ncbi:lysophospholipid acyltransferase family protein [Synechococcus sp. CCY9202]|uniref:lysophospholipid acyltransferase family protein n=1 Tax=Synechococcus sp. CCY9202 TaxID=174698 RepID=UPI002B21D404|nr:lysophospholipid acyltransferase family protein [Synechococcus sp. CCY9202]MEA5423666.1 lysophospholipid acyltransferase family protein [Synechococcus sp. CCY9202]
MQHPIPLQLSRSLLGAAGISASLHNLERIPTRNRLLIVSNHRSLFDAPLLMTAISRPVRFVYHYYMSQVPLLQQAMMLMGAFPLETGQGRQSSFFLKSARFLQDNQVVGVFPEGADPMVKVNAPHQLSPFHRGFAHLALRVPVDDLAILPVAIASRDEKQGKLAPLEWFRRFDPSEALFQGDGWHSAVVYRHVDVFFGYPLLIDKGLRSRYRGSSGATVVREITQVCWSQIAEFLAHRRC